MAGCLQSYVVSDLCLGKPALKSLSISSTVSDALLALKNSEENFISIWDCNHQNPLSSTAINNNQTKIWSDDFECQCVGKICMVDIICFLCRDEHALSSPALSSVLDSPVSVILPKTSGLVKHLEPSSSFLEAIDLIVGGAQNLVVPIKSTKAIHSRRKQLPKTAAGHTTFHGGREYCWLTPEDVVGFILSRISLFSPLPALSIDSLDIIRSDVLAIHYQAPATNALDAISQSLSDQTSVAVIDDDGSLINEISPSTFSASDETVAAAIMTLSCADLIAYMDWYRPPEDLVRVMRLRLKEKHLDGLLSILDDEYSIISSPDASSASSSDDDSSSETSSRSPATMRLRRSSRYMSFSGRRPEATICHPGSSVIAVMIQAIAHRTNYVWVVEDDCSLVGIVTFRAILKVFRDHIQSMGEY
ncbi:hypothetical protein Ancab_025389 [Ancistrocladus abbreviatus]